MNDVMLRWGLLWLPLSVALACGPAAPDTDQDGGPRSDGGRADAASLEDAGADASPLDAGEPEVDAGAEEPVVPPFDWEVIDGAANTSRTFFGDRVGRRIFEVAFRTTVAGEKRWVEGLVNVEQAELAGGDALMMVVASLSCVDSSGSVDPQNAIGFTQNVVRPSPLTLRPQLVFTGGEPGTYRCRIGVQGGRPRPDGLYDETKFTVETGSFVRVSTPLHPSAAQSYSPRVPSTVLDDGEAYDAAPLMWEAPEGVDSITAFGSVKLTTCTSVGGSDDPYDSLPELCGLPEHEIDFAGSNMTVSFSVLQVGTDGTYCARTTLPADPGLHVSKDTHHEMVVRQADVPVSNAPDCTREFRIKSYVRQRNGASVVVHRQGTLTGVIPR